jgi:ABC-2 type transport system permease protein
LPLVFSEFYVPALAAAGLAIVYLAIRPSRLRKKLSMDEDED